MNFKKNDVLINLNLSNFDVYYIGLPVRNFNDFGLLRKIIFDGPSENGELCSKVDAQLLYQEQELESLR